MKERLHHLLDLALEIQMRGKGENGFPHVTLEFSNYGMEMSIYIDLDGYNDGPDFDFSLSFSFDDGLALNAAEIALKETLEIAVEKECESCTQ